MKPRTKTRGGTGKKKTALVKDKRCKLAQAIMVCYISLFSEFSMLMYYVLFYYYVLCSHVRRVAMETYQPLIMRTKCGLRGCFSTK